MASTLKDPVCGMPVQTAGGLTAILDGQDFYFCSELCRSAFYQHPDRYRDSLSAPASDEAKENRHIAYLSMEVALDSSIPTYWGGLGILAGDTLKSCADLRVPVVGVTLLFRKGYFEQRIEEAGWQKEEPAVWTPGQFLQLLPETIQVEIEQRLVLVRAWQYLISGQSDYVVPVIFLDTDLDGNSEYDRSLTHFLYGGDERYRIAQEIVLGIGGTKMLRALGYTEIQKFHMNEGHAGLLVLELLRQQLERHPAEWDFDSVRNRCVFTTHTPVPAGHDQFVYHLVQRVLGQVVPSDLLQMLAGRERLNMTWLGLDLSRYVNGVAIRHEEVSKEMFPGYPIHHITNGVHSPTWTCDSFKALYDRHLPGWSNDPSMLRKAVSIPRSEIWGAHAAAKYRLLTLVKDRAGRSLSPDVLTTGFARRATPYKRAGLIFRDVNRLLDIASDSGPLQFIYTGKAHPRDYAGKEVIRHIISAARQLRDRVEIIYLENYDMDLAKLIVSGVDLWLNTPQRPLEASGASGMKAAHNGVLNFSILDGWWIEGHIEGVTGWSIGPRDAGSDPENVNASDAEDLYEKLKMVIVPMFYRDRERWEEMMQHSIALNASHFNTHRMVQQYVTNAYLP